MIIFLLNRHVKLYIIIIIITKDGIDRLSSKCAKRGRESIINSDRVMFKIH